MKIYIFFILTVINVIVFLKMNNKKNKNIKYRISILYFYLMFFICGDVLLSIKYGELPANLLLIIFTLLVIIANAIFLTVKE
ncbi:MULTISPECIES: hypothetical protein [Enterobacterales]|uniref:hypothetical protein n=1 Tax=Enterobacterales TaxID=91347 RepID=UPI0008482919|nr:MULTISPECIES: hypothetical protein [Enterobacterales]ODQ06398.1 hypothetical protein BGK50_18310 [Shigella sp. FC130]OEI93939.1 hypothetical protein BHE86_17055 [Shigella sp. FC1655]WOO51307.1 hypothetical protein R2S03_09165 [Hafnia alvei]WPF05780.1 hypothetical protein SB028_08015 [Proteus vulgaris]